MKAAWKSPAVAFCLTCLFGPLGVLYLDWRSALKVILLHASLILMAIAGLPSLELEPNQPVELSLVVARLPLWKSIALCTSLALWYLGIPVYSLLLARRRNGALGLSPPRSFLLPQP